MTARERPHSPTIFDVADLAGVSKSTVSNVTRGVGGVADATRERVETAIAELDYRPNVLARQFVQQRTTILGVLVGDLNNPFYAELATRVEERAFKSGFTAMYCNVEGHPEQAVARVRALLAQRVAGVVFLAALGLMPEVESELRADVPIVFAGVNGRGGDSVSISDSAGGRLAGEHLAGLGHRRLAFLTSPHVEEGTARARREGFNAALRSAGLTPAATVRWDESSETARVGRETRPLASLLEGRARVTGVFCANDLAAISLMEFCDRHGAAVPGDVSVVGFDDIHVAGLARISLTTVRQPLDEIATTAVEMLVRRLDGRRSGRPAHRSADPQLAVRGSTAPPRRG